jgi:hypothetical protein
VRRTTRNGKKACGDKTIITTRRYGKTFWKQQRNEERSRGGWRRAGSEKAQERGKIVGKIVRAGGERWVI